MRHLARLLLPSTATASSSAAAAFSTSKRAYPSRAKPRPPPPSESPAEDAAGDDGDAPPPADPAAWQREKVPSELPRPPTIPFQPSVANAVRLVGTVGAPVQLQRLPDGRFSAVSVLVQDRRTDFPKFWIPVIFQDDLAQIAASHLQEKDLVYVSGQLTGDVPPFKHTDGQANIQVVAHLLSFVDSKAVETDLMVDEEEGFMEIAEAEKKVEQTKPVSKYPARTFSDYKAKQDKYRTLWNDVLANPLNWTDNRAEKANGSKNPKYPDFKNKTADEALWLDSAPHYVLEKLDGLTFNSGYNAAKTCTNTGWSKFKTSQAASPEKQKKEAELWQSLVDSPQSWWDNRADKRSPKAPDFKHKDTGEALWLSPKTPSWVTDALPPVRGGSRGGARRPETLLS
ncbi:protein OSB2, chloroplastic-like isoform X2 [Triticum dicoccoides]|uniref:protein OSB2, chloroplastic-like isoform X2 n=1 Tax=Triticum dicoccoides TaxID=85692 RepID=UPI00188E5973|nr:protein OSB2, chloroplastic-like isoform X2 [Triticum dicoccoides]